MTFNSSKKGRDGHLDAEMMWWHCDALDLGRLRRVPISVVSRSTMGDMHRESMGKMVQRT